MPAPSKRTRATSSSGDNVQDSSRSPSPTASAPDTPTPTPTRRRQGPITTSANTPPPTRPIPSRSNSNSINAATPSTSSPLTRSSTLFSISTRRSSNGGGSSSSFASPSLPGPSGRGGTLLRTQSSPAITSPSQLKTAMAPGGSGRGKGDGDPEFELGPKRYGRGKENIPPKKDALPEEGSSRKRLRIGSRGPRNPRARSGSVSSMASEGRMPSAAPSSSSFSHRSSFPSPSPSPSTATSQSIETASTRTSVDPLDVLDEDYGIMDVDKTPTKPKTRQSTRRIVLPTPPSSSPFTNADVATTAERISLVRVQSDVSNAETETEDTQDGIDIKKLGPYKHLKKFLRLSNGNGTIIGRDAERGSMNNYLEDDTTPDVGMYVSGPPGTGKTATVTALGKEIKQAGWDVIELSCMGLKLGDVWQRLGSMLDCAGDENEVTRTIRSRDTSTLLILDEIDSLMPPPPSTAPPTSSHLLSRIFSLPHSTNGKVKVIAISNTLDLTLRARLALPNGLVPLVVPFKAYVGQDMADIVKSRLETAYASYAEESAKVDDKALELLTKKVEAQNGDLRMCLGVLSSAVTLAETEWNKKVMTHTADNSEAASVPFTKIALAHIIKAINSYTHPLRAAAGSSNHSEVTTVTGKKIRSVPLQGKMVLVSMLVFLARVRAGMPGCPTPSSGSSTPSGNSPTKSNHHDALTTASLYATYAHLLSHHSSPYPPSPESDYRDLLSNLEVLGLVTVSGGGSAMVRTASTSSARSKTSSLRIKLCVRDEEVKAGLGLLEAVAGKKGLAEEEVARIWERENGKVQRYKEKGFLANVQKDDLDI